MKTQFIICDNCGGQAEHTCNGKGDRQTACPICDYYLVIEGGCIAMWAAPGLYPARVQQFSRRYAT